MASLIYNKGLSKELLNNIENGKFSTEEIFKFYHEILKQNAQKKKGFNLAAMMFGICAIFVIFIGMSASSGGSIFIGFIAIIIVGAIALGYIKVNFVEKAKKQFVNAVHKGYPELVEKVN